MCSSLRSYPVADDWGSAAPSAADSVADDWGSAAPFAAEGEGVKIGQFLMTSYLNGSYRTWKFYCKGDHDKHDETRSCNLFTCFKGDHDKHDETRSCNLCTHCT